MEIQHCMKHNVVFIYDTMTLREAAETFTARHVGTLPVVNHDQKLVGILQLHDLLSLVLPDFLHLVKNFDFVQDFGAVEERQPTLAALQQDVSRVMSPVRYVRADSGLLRTFALMHHYQLHDIPVLDAQDKLVGIVSRVDIQTALFNAWTKS